MGALFSSSVNHGKVSEAARKGDAASLRAWAREKRLPLAEERDTAFVQLCQENGNVEAAGILMAAGRVPDDYDLDSAVEHQRWKIVVLMLERIDSIGPDNLHKKLRQAQEAEELEIAYLMMRKSDVGQHPFAAVLERLPEQGDEIRRRAAAMQAWALGYLEDLKSDIEQRPRRDVAPAAWPEPRKPNERR